MNYGWYLRNKADGKLLNVDDGIVVSVDTIQEATKFDTREQALKQAPLFLSVEATDYTLPDPVEDAEKPAPGGERPPIAPWHERQPMQAVDGDTMFARDASPAEIAAAVNVTALSAERIDASTDQIAAAADALAEQRAKRDAISPSKSGTTPGGSMSAFGKIAALGERSAKFHTDLSNDLDEHMRSYDTLDRRKRDALAKHTAYRALVDTDLKNSEAAITHLTNLPLGGSQS